VARLYKNEKLKKEVPRRRGVTAIPRFWDRTTRVRPVRPTFEILCRGLCRNLTVPASVATVHSVSIVLTCVALESHPSRMNIASSYGLTFFGVAPSRRGSRFDTVEVWVRAVQSWADRMNSKKAGAEQGYPRSTPCAVSRTTQRSHFGAQLGAHLDQKRSRLVAKQTTDRDV
jgi:hypothetical protein